MIRWLKSLFAWKLVRDQGVWRYYENAVTGQRKAERISSCWSPLDRDWLDRTTRQNSLGPPPRPSK
ncbi:MAG: hypothetical protein KGM49_00605 [Sphingomonadales bacterium]|nr:hypothetical protein [Sphingomonadales bacterium]